MADCTVQVELLTELDGFLIVRGFAFHHASKRAPHLSFRDSDTGDSFETTGTIWFPRPEVAATHSLSDDNVGFRAALAVPANGRPFDPARLEILTRPATGAANLPG